jgi:SAM-dependent methyltransferase
MASPAHSPSELERYYDARFAGRQDYRHSVWRVLIEDYFSRWTANAESVLDLGCGFGEFINQVESPKRFAIDLNPASRSLLAEGVKLFSQDCSEPWPLAADSLDLVFTSNFFEHLPSKEALLRTLRETNRCLRPGGRIVAMGPNIRFLPGAYWDFFDHYVPLTERSLAEALAAEGFRSETVIDRFLPYSMSQGSEPPLWMLRAYLRLPLSWPFFGKQFLVVAAKS